MGDLGMSEEEMLRSLNKIRYESASTSPIDSM